MTTRKAGVMGWPVAHSLSPRLHGFWLKQHGIDGSYEALAVKIEDLGQNLKELSNKGFVGVNLTVPHKELALPFVSDIDALALRVGAINTITVDADGNLHGLNTDVFGFSQNILEGGFKVNQRPVALLGAGGAARGAIVSLMDLGVSEIRLANRTTAKAHDLVQEFGSRLKVFSWDAPEFLKDVSLLVNATSLGMRGQPALVLDLKPLPHDAIVTDMVYAPLMTDLLVRAAARGNKTIDGLGMLLHQARPAFKAFFGVDPQVTSALRAHILEGKA